MRLAFSLIATLSVACIQSVAGTRFFVDNNAVCAVKAAVILPFGASNGKADVNYLDFYSGVLLAAKNLNSSGMDVSLKVIDHSASEISYDDLQDCDMVIGPVSRAQQAQVAGLCLERNIPFISPMDQESAPDVEANRCFYQVPASFDTQVANLIKSLAEGPEGPVTVFHSSLSGDSRFFERVVCELENSSIPYRKVSYEVTRGREITDSFRQSMALEEGLTNKVIIASEDVAFASDVVRNMSILIHAGIPVSVYGSPRLRNFNTIDSEMLYTVNFHTSTPYYVNYQDESTRNFILDYRNYFNAEPTPYSFQGYDILFYFAGMKRELGITFPEFIQYYPGFLLQNNLQFEQYNGTEEGGWFNAETKNIEYRPDGTVLLH